MLMVDVCYKAIFCYQTLLLATDKLQKAFYDTSSRLAQTVGQGTFLCIHCHLV